MSFTVTRPGHSNHRPARTLTILLAAAAGLAASSSAIAHADSDVPAPVDRAFRTVKAEGKMIMAWVYPSVAFRGLGDCAWTRNTDGFDLGCTLAYTDTDDTRAARQLVFRLNDVGLITSIRDAGGESIVPAFFTLSFTKEVFGRMAKEQLAGNSDTDTEVDKALLRLLATSPPPQRVLAFLLDVEIATGE
jgi:hypothetical protein